MSYRKHVVILLALASLLALPSAGRAHGGPSIVLNGGFETLDETGSAKWWGTRFAAETHEFVEMGLDTAGPRSNLRAASIAIDADHPDEAVDYGWVQSVQDFETNHKYKLAAWVRTENVATTPVLVVECLDADGEPLAVASSDKKVKNRVTGTSGWKKVKMGVKVPRGTRTVVVSALLRAPENAGARAWFDDVTLRPLD